MNIIYKGFTRPLLDNDSLYFQILNGILESVDELASLEVCKMPTTYNFRLIPSMPKYTNTLIQELTKLHNLFHLKLDLSKSIKSSSVIIYKIEHDG
jgi:hypothetical protein